MIAMILSALYLQHVIVYFDTAFLIVGGMLGLIIAVRGTRSGAWRNPLDLPRAHVLPALPADFIVVLFCAILILALGGWLISALATRLQDLFPDWQQMLLSDALVKCGGGALAAIALYRRSRIIPSALSAPAPFPWKVALLAFLITTPLVSLQLFAEEKIWAWLGGATLPEHEMLRTFLSGEAGELGKIQLIVSATVVSPIAEELFFRGVLLGALQHLSRRHWIAIAIQGMLFGMMHAAQPQAVLPLATFGMILGYVAVRTGSIPACILIHMLFNARTMAIAFLAPDMV
ncbi:MAG: lysostaphin resistance A-like protein [Phycisphaerae bacterium]